MVYLTTIKGERIEVIDWKISVDPIVNMEVQVNEKQFIVLEGFEAYSRLLTKVSCVTGGSKNFITDVILFGKTNDKIAVITLNLKKGKITQEVKSINQAFENKPLPDYCWKKGILNIPKIYLK